MEPNGPGTKATASVVALEFEQQSSTSEADGNQDPEDRSSSKNLSSHGLGKRSPAHLNPYPPQAGADL